MSLATLQLILIVMIPLAYLLGGVPFGLMVGRMRGVDVRQLGSGNTGATNVGRVLGRRYFFLVLFLDAMKSAVPAGVASLLVHLNTQPLERTPLLFALWLGTGVAALLGHVFSPFLGFKGGKGVATALGIALGVFPFMTLPGAVALVVFVAVYKATRYISAGSLAAATVFPVAYVGFALWRDWAPFGRQWPVLLLTSLMALLIIVRHRANIGRLLSGTEPPSRPRAEGNRQPGQGVE